MRKWDQRDFPMMITLSRMISAPLIIGLLTQEKLYFHVWASILFILASLTDYLDGYLARKLNAESNMGKFMDPIADKILITSVLVALIPLNKINTWMVIILLARDTLIGGLRSVAAADQIIIAAKPAGKWKTALQMVAIPAVIIGDTWLSIPFELIGFYVLWASVILSISSAFEYLFQFRRERRRSSRHK